MGALELAIKLVGLRRGGLDGLVKRDAHTADGSDGRGCDQAGFTRAFAAVSFGGLHVLGGR